MPSRYTKPSTHTLSKAIVFEAIAGAFALGLSIVLLIVALELAFISY